MTRTADTRKALFWEPKNLVRAIEAAGVTLWSWNVDTDALAMDERAYDRRVEGRDGDACQAIARLVGATTQIGLFGHSAMAGKNTRNTVRIVDVSRVCFIFWNLTRARRQC